MTPTQEIAELLLDSMKGLSGGEVSTLMREQLARLRLIDKDGSWHSPALEEIGDTLLPRTIDGDSVAVFIAAAARCAQANPCLVKLLARAKELPLRSLRHRLRTEGAAVVPQVVAYAIVLDRLTRAMHDDWRLTEACIDLWRRERERAGIGNFMSLFDRAKLASVESGIERSSFTARARFPRGSSVTCCR